jgi:hypothetical protein
MHTSPARGGSTVLKFSRNNLFCMIYFSCTQALPLHFAGACKYRPHVNSATRTGFERKFQRHRMPSGALRRFACAGLAVALGAIDARSGVMFASLARTPPPDKNARGYLQLISAMHVTGKPVAGQRPRISRQGCEMR